jgi:hypothetical protein
MSTNGNKCTLSSKVLMKLVLQGDEGLVASLVELHVAQDSARHEGSDFHGILLNNNLLKLSVRGLDQSVVGEGSPAQENVQHEGNALETQHVIPDEHSVYAVLI